MSSTASSSSLPNSVPSAAISFSPLYSRGLCDAVITMPASALSRTKYCTAGVGAMPTSITLQPVASSPAIAAQLSMLPIAGLLATGCKVIDVGIAPTPAVQYFVRDNADAGIVITASHNPREYNGLKLIAADGTEFGSEEELAVEDIYYRDAPKLADWRETGELTHVDILPACLLYTSDAADE